MDRCAIKHQLITEGVVMSTKQQLLLNCTFTRDDVKRVMLSIRNEKAPGINGFNSLFFKHWWEIVGDEVANC